MSFASSLASRRAWLHAWRLRAEFDDRPDVQEIELLVDAVPQGDVDLEDADPEGELDAHRWRMEVADAVSELPPRARRVLLMRYLDELTFEEIAQRLGISRWGACLAERSALRALRRVLAGRPHYMWASRTDRPSI